jgi:hypothetical protein
MTLGGLDYLYTPSADVAADLRYLDARWPANGHRSARQAVRGGVVPRQA